MKNLILLCSFILGCFVQVFGQEKSQSNEIDVYKVVEEMPRFPGCEEMTNMNVRRKCAIEKLKRFVSDNLIYPKQAKENKVEGTTVIRFIISKDGTMKEPTIVKDIGAGCGQAALEVIEKMNDMNIVWISGKQRGEPVNVYINLPIAFKLPKDKPIEKSAIATEKKSGSNATQSEEELVKVKEELPRFPGCEDISDETKRKNCSNKKMLEFIYSRLQYPVEARQHGVEGKVVISCIIKEDGTIAESTIKEDIGAGCGEEALRVINLMNTMPVKWIPGKQNGEIVDVSFNLPINFILHQSRIKKKKNRKKNKKKRRS